MELLTYTGKISIAFHSSNSHRGGYVQLPYSDEETEQRDAPVSITA
jgi:hypothetical protein